MKNNERKDNLCEEDTDKILLVEGINDCHVVMNLCEKHKLPDIFGIHQCKGNNGVLKRLNSLISRPNPPQIIGVMLDVDNHKNHTLESRWQSVTDKLKHYNYCLPITPDINGTIVAGIEDKPKLGFWFMPNNQDCGMLEDFCAELAEPLSLVFAQECVAQARSQGLTTFKEVHTTKAVIHTYLAWQDEPGYPLGKAISSQALRSNNDIATKFTNWLNNLFT